MHFTGLALDGLLTALVFLCAAYQAEAKASNFLVFHHVNDVHSRAIPAREGGSACRNVLPDFNGDKCYGGYARIVGMLKKRRAYWKEWYLKNEGRRNVKTYTVDAGDNAAGADFYQVYGLEHLPDYMNHAEFDYMTLGNHDFDDGDRKLGLAVSRLQCQVLGGNVQTKDAGLARKLGQQQNGHDILEGGRNGVRIVDADKLIIVGVTADETKKISNPDTTTNFLPEVEWTNQWVNWAKGQHPTYRVVVLSHIGFGADEHLAQTSRHISLIIGGHSHTGMGHDMWGMRHVDEYPAWRANEGGRGRVCIVQASVYGRYLGEVRPEWDDDGNLVGCHVEEPPLELGDDAPEDKEMKDMVDEWYARSAVLRDGGKKIGFSKYDIFATEKPLEGPEEGRNSGESLVGDVIADAMQWFAEKGHGSVLHKLETALKVPKVDFSFVNSGGVRVDIPQGPIIAAQLGDLSPFDDTLYWWRMSGRELMLMINGLYDRKNPWKKGLAAKMRDHAYVHYSAEVKCVYDRSPSSRDGARVKRFEVGGKAIEAGREYVFVTVGHLMKGKENILPPLKESDYSHNAIGSLRTALRAYVEDPEHNPLLAGDKGKRDGRLVADPKGY